MYRLICLLLIILPTITQSQEMDDRIADAKQLVVVTSNDWESSAASMHYFNRVGDGWMRAANKIDVMIGRTGMAWDRQFEGKKEGAEKEERDGKAPAGVFNFVFAFGYGGPYEAVFIQFPYMMTNKLIECVDDINSQYYNRVISTDIVAEKDWTSSEDMRRDDHLYKWGIVVDYNWGDHKEKGAGSCIFFHVWRDDTTPTAGCTAMPEENMVALLKWLEPEKKPVLVQMPMGEYEALREKLGLPSL